MIIVKTPLRIPLAGGGTDLPQWYKNHGSMFISGAINKYIYTTLHYSKFNKKIRARYSIMEEVDTPDQLQNEILKETLKYCHIKDSIEVTSHAEIPSGTGLGSSGAFGVSILHSLNPDMNKMDLFKISTHIQINILKYPIGLQDQATATLGYVRVYNTDKKGEVTCNLLNTDLEHLQNHLVLFFTGFKRDTNKMLKESSMEGLEEIQNLAWEMKKALESKDFTTFAELMNNHWRIKKKRGPMTNSKIDKYYQFALKNGAIGGKLIGAGGGGFLLFYSENPKRLIEKMPLLHIPFSWDMEGSKVLINE